MAIKRSDLRNILPDTENITDEQISKLLNLFHTETDPLRDQIDDLNTRLSTAKTAGSDDAKKWKDKYDAEKKAHDDYRKEVDAKATKETKKAALRELIKNSGLSKKGLEMAEKYANLEGFELDESGNLKNSGEILKSIKDEWSVFVTNTETHGENVDNPPGGGKGSTFEKMTLDDKMAYANEHPDAPEVTAWLSK